MISGIRDNSVDYTIGYWRSNSLLTSRTRVTVTFPLTRQILNPEFGPETQSVHVARKQTSIKVRDLDNGKREDDAGSHHSCDVAAD